MTRQFLLSRAVHRLYASTVALGRFAPWLLATFTLCVSLSATYWLWANSKDEEAHAMRAGFGFRAREVVELIQQRMAAYEQVLRGAQGFLISSEQVTPQEFHSYVKALHLEEHYPGIQGLAIASIVPREQKERHIAQMRQRFPDYAIFPSGEREIYVVIKQIEPLQGVNVAAIGFDMFSEPLRRAAMLKARDSGKAAVSGKVQLMQDTSRVSQPGFVMYLPVYKRGMPIDLVEQRRVAIDGWMSAVFQMNALMAGIGGARSDELTIDIYDGGAMTPQSKLFASGRLSAQRSASAPSFHTTQHIMVAGHPWTVVIGAGPAFEAAFTTGKPTFIAIAGSMASILLALLIGSLASGRAGALALARKMTAHLRESEEWLKLALDAAQLGVMDWDIKNDIIFRSPRHDQIFGYHTPPQRWQMRTFIEHLLPEDRADFQMRLHECWQTGNVDLVFRIVQAGGGDPVGGRQRDYVV